MLVFFVFFYNFFFKKAAWRSVVDHYATTVTKNIIATTIASAVAVLIALVAPLEFAASLF